MKTLSLTKHIIAQEVDPAFALRSRYILNTIARSKSKKILDAGCGRGFYVKLFTLVPGVEEIKGFDINTSYLAKAKLLTKNDNRVELIKTSIYKLPYEDNYFDCVVCSEVLEHLEDDARAVRELYRVLKPQGRLVVSVPHIKFPFLWDPLNWILMKIFKTHVNKNIWWLAGIWADHERLYSKEQLRNLLTTNGFTTKKLKDVVSWSWPFSHFMLYAVGKNIVERLGSKTFDRFNFSDTRYLSRFLAAFMRFPSRVLDRNIPMGSSVDLFIEATKNT